MSKRGDAELASVMRKLLTDDDTLTDFTWRNVVGDFQFRLSGDTVVTEEEAQAIEEAQE